MKIPSYKRVADVPGGSPLPKVGAKMPLSDPASRGMRDVAGAIGHMSDLANARYQQLKKERQALGVADAISQLRRFENEKVIPMYGLTGRQAVGDINDPEKSPGVYRQSLDLYGDEIERIAGGITDPEMSTAFLTRAASIRDSGLESLARHEATQHQVLKKNTFDATLTNLTQTVSVNWSNSATVESAIDEIKNLADETFPGLDMSATKMQAEASLRATVLKRMSETSPEDALNHLRAWKDKLGQAYYQLQGPIESEALFRRVRTAHPSDFNAMEDAAQTSEFDQSVKNAVSGWIRAAEAEQKRRSDEAKRQRRVDGYNNFWGFMREGNITQAMKSAGNLNDDDFTQAEKFQLEQYARQGAVKNDALAEKSLHLQIKMGLLTDAQQLYNKPEMLSLGVDAIRRLESQIEKEKQDPSHYGPAISLLEQRFDRIYKDTDFYALKPTFASELMNDIDREEEVKKRKLTSQEIIDVGNRLLDQKIEVQSFFGIDWLNPDEKTREFTQRVESREGGQQAQKPTGTSEPSGAQINNDPLGIRAQ